SRYASASPLIPPPDRNRNSRRSQKFLLQRCDIAHLPGGGRPSGRPAAGPEGPALRTPFASPARPGLNARPYALVGDGLQAVPTVRSPHIQKLVEVQDDVREGVERLRLDERRADSDLLIGWRTRERNSIRELHLRLR